MVIQTMQRIYTRWCNREYAAGYCRFSGCGSHLQVTPKLISESVGQQQFRKKPNRAKDQRTSLECLKNGKNASGPRIQAEASMGWVWKVRLLGIWKESYKFWT